MHYACPFYFSRIRSNNSSSTALVVTYARACTYSDFQNGFFRLSLTRTELDNPHKKQTWKVYGEDFKVVLNFESEWKLVITYWNFENWFLNVFFELKLSKHHVLFYLNIFVSLHRHNYLFFLFNCSFLNACSHFYRKFALQNKVRGISFSVYLNNNDL